MTQQQQAQAEEHRARERRHLGPRFAVRSADLGRRLDTFLVVAIAALGVKTSFQKLAELGWQPMALMVGETVFLAGLILGGLMVLRQFQ